MAKLRSQGFKMAYNALKRPTRGPGTIAAESMLITKFKIPEDDEKLTDLVENIVDRAAVKREREELKSEDVSLAKEEIQSVEGDIFRMKEDLSEAKMRLRLLRRGIKGK